MIDCLFEDCSCMALTSLAGVFHEPQPVGQAQVPGDLQGKNRLSLSKNPEYGKSMPTEYSANAFSVLQSIAEERIREAQRDGVFDDLPGKGVPLHLEDESGIPEELRMAYHVLKNAGMVPREVQERKEISNLADMLEKDCDEHTKVTGMRRLEALILHARLRTGRNIALHADEDAYLDKILDKIAQFRKGTGTK